MVRDRVSSNGSVNIRVVCATDPGEVGHDAARTAARLLIGWCFLGAVRPERRSVSCRDVISP